MDDIKFIPMNSFRPLDVYIGFKVTKELIEEIKKQSKIIHNDLMVKQELVYGDDRLVLKEKALLKGEDYKINSTTEVYLKEGDILTNKGNGYGKNLLSVKLISDKEFKTIEKFNKIGKIR
jgi:uncharacterized protein with PhoU and TrkA domain